MRTDFVERRGRIEEMGSTPDEALREVQFAKHAWLEAAMASGKPISEPRYRPFVYQIL
jgi:predicted RNase H-like HicB family nuclease